MQKTFIAKIEAIESGQRFLAKFSGIEIVVLGIKDKSLRMKIDAYIKVVQ